MDHHIEAIQHYPSFLASFLFVTIILTVGLIATILLLGFGQGPNTSRRLLIEMLMEKNTDKQGLISFSRVSGLLGSLALTAMFVSVVYWVQFAIFTNTNLAPISKLWPGFAIGSALYAPYAFNKIVSLRT